MKIVVKQDFYDAENDLQLRKTGEELEVSEQRGAYLIKQGFAVEPEGEEVPEPDPEAEKKPKTTKPKK